MAAMTFKFKFLMKALDSHGTFVVFFI